MEQGEAGRFCVVVRAERGLCQPLSALRAAKLRSQLKSRLFATAQPIPNGTVKCLPCPSSQQKQQLNLY